MQESLKRAISGLVYVVIMWIGASYSKSSYIILFSFLGFISFLEMWKLRKGKSKFIPITYVIIPFILIQLFVVSDTNTLSENIDSSIVLFMFLLTWTFDTFAYIIGMNFGRSKILPRVSPQKSWEGFVGGYFFTVIAAYILYPYFGFEVIIIPLIMGGLIPITATLGDFIESHYKREANVKDSGKLIPGHGGILDRMDAFLITIPLVYIIKYYL